GRAPWAGVLPLSVTTFGAAAPSPPAMFGAEVVFGRSPRNDDRLCCALGPVRGSLDTTDAGGRTAEPVTEPFAEPPAEPLPFEEPWAGWPAVPLAESPAPPLMDWAGAAGLALASAPPRCSVPPPREAVAGTPVLSVPWLKPIPSGFGLCWTT